MNKYILLILLTFPAISMAQTSTRLPVYERQAVSVQQCEQVPVQEYRSRSVNVGVNALIDEVLMRVAPEARPIAGAVIYDANARRRVESSQIRYEQRCWEDDRARDGRNYREVLVGYRIITRYSDGSSRETFERIR